jgi:hypothetical protein
MYILSRSSRKFCILRNKISLAQCPNDFTVVVVVVVVVIIIIVVVVIIEINAFKFYDVSCCWVGH